MPFLTKGKTNWKYILIVVILGLIVEGGILGYLRYFEKEIKVITQISEIKKPEYQKIANWKIYKNEEYGFEIKYPEDWEVEESKIGHEKPSPIFSIHKKGEDPKTDSRVSSITIFPEGFSTSLPDDINMKEKTIYLSGKKANSLQFLTKEGKVWLEIISIKDKNLPPKWNSYNRIEIEPKSNLEWECAVPHKTREECDYGEGRIFTGQVDEYEWKLLNQILSTLKFLK